MPWDSNICSNDNLHKKSFPVDQRDYDDNVDAADDDYADDDGDTAADDDDNDDYAAAADGDVLIISALCKHMMPLLNARVLFIEIDFGSHRQHINLSS